MKYGPSKLVGARVQVQRTRAIAIGAQVVAEADGTRNPTMVVEGQICDGVAQELSRQ